MLDRCNTCAKLTYAVFKGANALIHKARTLRAAVIGDLEHDDPDDSSDGPDQLHRVQVSVLANDIVRTAPQGIQCTAS